jgi:O-antigen/teichoic acid export membrane protein
VSESEPLIGTNRKTVAKVLRSSLASNTVGAMVNLLIIPRVLHGVGVERYGEWATLAAVLAIGQLAQSGAATEIARRVAVAYSKRDEEALRRAVREGVTVLCGIAVVLEMIALTASGPIVDLVFPLVPHAQHGQLTLLLAGILTLFVIGLVGNGYFSVLTGLQRSDYMVWSNVAGVVAAGVATVVGLALGMGLWALFTADCVQLVVSFVGPAIGVRRLVPALRFALVRVSRSVIAAFIGMPAMLVAAQASDVFDNQVDKLVLTHTVGPKSSAMFQIGAGLVQALRGVALVPLAVMLAGTAELHLTDPTRLRRLESLSSSATQAIAATTAGGLILFAEPFIRVWLGPGYGGAALTVRVLAAAALLNVWSAPWIYYAIGRRRYHYVLMGAGITLVVNATATIVLTVHIGLNGALIGSVAGSAAGTLTGRIVLWRWERRPWLRPALRATGTMAVAVVPLLLAGIRIPASWPPLIGFALVYLAASGLLLLATGSLPVKVVSRGRGRPTLKWRGAD